MASINGHSVYNVGKLDLFVLYTKLRKYDNFVISFYKIIRHFCI
jgi:hypothetical protein